MSAPSNEEILRLLDRLEEVVADDLETEFLEFKPWDDPKKCMRVATEYTVCFANAEGGVIVFGVADRVRGRQAAIHGVGRCDLDVWRKGIYESTRPNLSVSLDIVEVPEGTGKLLLVRVPKGAMPPHGTTQGLFKQRVGKNCMAIDPQAFARSRVTSGAIDWSGLPAEESTRNDLDPVEIARGRNILKRLRPTSDLASLNDDEFLQAIGAMRHGRITHVGLLLFGHEEALSDQLPQHQVHYVYESNETQALRNDSYRFGLLQTLDRIEQAFSGPLNPEQELTAGLFKLRIPAFHIEVVREALLNAVTHRDYSDPNEVLVRHTKRQMVVTSPGGFLGGITPKNILRHEPVARNRALAETLEKLGLVERAGMGRRRIFAAAIVWQAHARV